MLVTLLSGSEPVQTLYEAITAAELKKTIASHGVVHVDTGNGPMHPDRLQMSDNMIVDLYTRAGLEERVSNLLIPIGLLTSIYVLLVIQRPCYGFSGNCTPIFSSFVHMVLAYFLPGSDISLALRLLRNCSTYSTSLFNGLYCPSRC